MFNQGGNRGSIFTTIGRLKNELTFLVWSRLKEVVYFLEI